MRRLLIIFFTPLFLFSCKNDSSQTAVSNFTGTWRLRSRTDKTSDGKIVPEPNLGSDPVAILFYDLKGNMSVQIMKKTRDTIQGNLAYDKGSSSTNTGSFAGYDAYFGKYEIDFNHTTITHILEGALIPSDVGKKLKRNFEFKDNKLYLSFEALNNLSGRVTRTLMWEKIN